MECFFAWLLFAALFAYGHHSACNEMVPSLNDAIALKSQHHTAVILRCRRFPSGFK